MVPSLLAPIVSRFRRHWLATVLHAQREQFLCAETICNISFVVLWSKLYCAIYSVADYYLSCGIGMQGFSA